MGIGNIGQKMLLKYVVILVTCLALKITNSDARMMATKPRSQSHGLCWTDIDCKSKSFCVGNDIGVAGTCKCFAGFVLYTWLYRNSTSYECLAGATLGTACEKNLECQHTAGVLARCNHYKVCECKNESHNYKGVCYLKAKIGDKCVSHENCYLKNGGFGVCFKGRCSCRAGQIPSKDRNNCLPRKLLGEACIADEQCTSTTPNTKCLGTCKCAIMHITSRNESACVKAAVRFGQSCDFDGQCSKFLLGSVCSRGMCGCEAGFHGYGVRCVASRKEGERCEEDAQCVYKRQLYENIKCQDEICKCSYGSLHDGSCRIGKISYYNYNRRFLCGWYLCTFE